VALHVLGHVEAQELDAETCASWRVTSVLPTPVGPANRKADRLALIAEAGARHLDGDASASTALSWPKITSFRLRSRLRSTSLSVARDGLRRDARDARDHVLDVLHVDHGRAGRRGLQPLPRTGLVDDVDGLVRQVPVVDEARGQFAAAFDGESSV
jgi:hypothetical protein